MSKLNNGIEMKEIRADASGTAKRTVKPNFRNYNNNTNLNNHRKLIDLRNRTIKAGKNYGPLSKEQIAASQEWGKAIGIFKTNRKSSKTRKNQRKRK